MAMKTNLLEPLLKWHWPPNYYSTTTSKAETVPKKVYPRDPILEERFDIERRAWEYYGFAWTRILERINHEKCQRRREMRMINYQKNKLGEWKKQLEKREQELQVGEPFLSAAKKLQEMKLTLDDVSPWIQMVEEVAHMHKITIKQAAISVAQDLKFYRELGGVQRHIERANQELALINMAAIKKQQALTVVEDLLNRGVTESQVIQLTNFAAEWDRYWQSSAIDNFQQPGSSHPTHLTQANGNNSHSFSMNDYLRLQLLQASTSNILTKLGVKN